MKHLILIALIYSQAATCKEAYLCNTNSGKTYIVRSKTGTIKGNLLYKAIEAKFNVTEGYIKYTDGKHSFTEEIICEDLTSEFK
jgi:hypothetical protein